MPRCICTVSASRSLHLRAIPKILRLGAKLRRPDTVFWLKIGLKQKLVWDHATSFSGINALMLLRAISRHKSLLLALCFVGCGGTPQTPSTVSSSSSSAAVLTSAEVQQVVQ